MSESFSLWGRRDVLLVGAAAVGFGGCAILRGGAKHPLLAPGAAQLEGAKLMIRNEALASLQAGGVLEVRPGDPFAPFLLTRHGDELRAIAAKCTHKGCIVGHDAASGEWICPCHDSRFAADGSVIEGPAKAALAPIPMQAKTDGIVVDLTLLAPAR